ncbi:uncharacterized protein LOC119720063 [Patiria miniata]|uniref:ZMYM2-like/QRICH1 C-terminal domain-containing protein n=1 Tax=Patiria miniata TaxID=46514 RepID=A0A913Z1G4_PATMI|nr:uncharacterized protein LOC119720063 [Patiria miniata]
MAATSTDVPTFASISDIDLKDLIDAADSNNTKKQIKYAINRLDAYARFVGTTLSAVEALSMRALDEFLCRFYASLRKLDGKLYTKKSMQGIRYGLQRHIQALHDWDLSKQREFAGSNKVFKAMLVKLKREGKGFVRHKSPISVADMEKMQASNDLDMSTPRGLQNKVFVDVMVYFCNRGRENLRDMKPSDFIISQDEDDIQYVTRRDQMTKNNRENDDESSSGFMYEIPDNDRCPVRSLKLYLSKLNPKSPDTFWQRPKETAPPDDGPWYCIGPVGTNTLGSKMKIISTKAGCSKVYTNHCLRATCVTVLDSAGFASRDIMSVSGHHSEQSIKHYSKTSDDKKKQMSAALASQLTVNQQDQHYSELDDDNNKPSTHQQQNRSTALENINLPLTSSQEEEILQELSATSATNALNITNDVKSTTSQNFNFHGCVVNFYNAK